MSMQTENLFKKIEELQGEMVQALMELVRIPAIAPENGGEGEAKKAEKLLQILNTLGLDDIERCDAKDERVPSKKRPNIIVRYEGETTEETLWIVTHLDVVPPGEQSLWTVTKPFQPIIKDGKIYGRGSEDNAQSMVCSTFAVKALKNLGIRPKRTVALCFVADEEQGSTYGIQHLIEQGHFRKNDLIAVPDSGNENGSFVEIAEKSVLWFRIRTIGKQVHASRPHQGLNAHRVGMEYAAALDNTLHKKYSCRDDYFDPPESTIEPTKKDKNVDAINIVPGEDSVYFDCRVLPNYNLDEMIAYINNLAREFEKKTGAKIKFELVQKSVAPKPTDANSKIVSMMRQAIKRVRGIEPKVGGIGGGTCAAFFRKIDAPAVVWSTIDETAHQPDEYTKIQNLIDDAKVFGILAIS